MPKGAVHKWQAPLPEPGQSPVAYAKELDKHINTYKKMLDYGCDKKKTAVIKRKLALLRQARETALLGAF